MATLSMDNDLVKKTLRSVTMERKTAEEIQESYTKLFPPSFLFRKSPSVTLPNLCFALSYLVKEGYVTKEITRYLERPLKEDTNVYFLSSKGITYTSKRK